MVDFFENTLKFKNHTLSLWYIKSLITTCKPNAKNTFFTILNSKIYRNYRVFKPVSSFILKSSVGLGPGLFGPT